jgi:hypothetical protein
METPCYNRTMKPQSITFAIKGRTDGPDFSPERVPLSVLKEFSADVETLLRGDSKEIDTATLEVSVVEGSLGIQTQPIPLAPVLFHDLSSLLNSDQLDSIDPKRKNVIERWQKQARIKKLSFSIMSDALLRPVVISSSTDFRANDADQWVRVERYVRGEITDLGGAREPNAHIRLPDGKILTARTNRDLLRTDKFNRLYKAALVRIRAEYNVKTKELREAELIEFVEYSPKFDPLAFAKLTERGAKAWSDVPDAAAWVEDLRGGQN